MIVAGTHGRSLRLENAGWPDAPGTTIVEIIGPRSGVYARAHLTPAALRALAAAAIALAENGEQREQHAHADTVRSYLGYPAGFGDE